MNLGDIDNVPPLGSGNPLTGGRAAGADLSTLYFRKAGNDLENRDWLIG